MARVPYDEGVPSVAPATAVPDDYLHVRAGPESFGGLIAQGEQKLGEGATKAGVFYGEVAADQQVNNYYGWLHTKLHGTGQTDPVTGQVDAGYLGLKGQAALDARPQVEAEIEAKRKEVLGTLTTADQEHLFDTASRRIQYYALDRIGEWDDQQRYVHSKGVNDDTYKNGLALVGANPDNPAALQQGLDMLRSGKMKNLALDGMDKDDAAVTQSLHQVNADFMQTRIRALAPNDPTRALDLLNKNRADLSALPGYDTLSSHVESAVIGSYQAQGLANLNGAYARFQKDQDNLPPEVRDRLDGWFTEKRQAAQDKADREEDRHAARARVPLDRSLSAASAIVDNGQSATAALSNVTDKQIDAAFPKDPDQAQAVKERFNDLRTVSAFQDRMAGSTPEQLNALLASVPKPDPNDPGTYRERLTMTRALATAMERTSKALASDPAGYVVGSHPEIGALGAAADKDPAQFPAYATAVLGVQTQMGVPETARSVLPMAAAQSMAADVMADPSGAPAKLKQMEQQYGTYWPLVWRDLSTVKGGLPPNYQAVSVLDNERDGALLARWMGEAQKSQKTADELLGDKPVSDIRASVRSDPGVMALASSLARSGSSATQVAGVLGAVDDLAFAKSFYDRDPNAAQSAIESFTSKYEFMPNGGARVPASRFNDVSTNAASTLHGLNINAVAIPPIFGQPGQPKPEEYLDLLRASPSWVTSPKADALWLMDPQGRIVRTKGGDPVSVPFDDMPRSEPSSSVSGVDPGALQ